MRTKKEIGRHRLRYHPVINTGRNVLTERREKLDTDERWELLYRTEYSLQVGRRLKRVREGQQLTQGQALERVRKPNGGSYSNGFLSRVEAGYANSPLYAYISIAEGYELDPARVLGPEEAEKPVGEAELMLIKLLRRAGLSPDEAIARLARF